MRKLRRVRLRQTDFSRGLREFAPRYSRRGSKLSAESEPVKAGRACAWSTKGRNEDDRGSCCRAEIQAVSCRFLRRCADLITCCALHSTALNIKRFRRLRTCPLVAVK